MRLTEYYADAEDRDDSIYRNQSNFCPARGRNRTLDVILDSLARIPLSSNTKRAFNLPKKEFEALKEIEDNQQIIIKEADKGKAVVIMDKDFYQSKITEMLEDPLTYEKQNANQDKVIMSRLHSHIESTNAQITEDEKSFLTTFEVKSSNFYGLPKVHKSKDLAKEIEGNTYVHIPAPKDLTFRPIVAGPVCPTHRLSKLLDKLLQPYLQEVHSFVRDDIHFLSLVPRDVPNDTVLLTCDVVNLYNIIPHNAGINALEYWLTKKPDLLHPRFTKEFILASAKFILENNGFLFNEEYFIQTRGTAMGTNFAPAYAILFMAHLEETRLYIPVGTNMGDDIADYVKRHFRRYIDDCFIPWPYGDDKLQEFLEILRSMDPSVKFTTTTSQTSVPFLDILVTKAGTRLTCDIYSKPTDSKRYLPFQSSHPWHIKKNIPYNLARRIRTIVDDDGTEAKRLFELTEDLQRQGYPSKLIESGLQRAKAIPKQDLRASKPAPPNDNKIPMVTTYNENNPEIYPQVATLFDILKEDDETKGAFRNKHLIKAKRQEKNLKKLLCRAKFPLCDDDPQVRKCGKPRCKLCDCLHTGREITLENGRVFKVRNSMNCETTNVIYLLKCGACNKDYIGETNNLRLRINLHRQHIENPTYRILGVSKHIAECAKALPLREKIVVFHMYRVYGTALERAEKEKFFIALYHPSLNTTS